MIIQVILTSILYVAVRINKIHAAFSRALVEKKKNEIDRDLGLICKFFAV